MNFVIRSFSKGPGSTFSECPGPGPGPGPGPIYKVCHILIWISGQCFIRFLNIFIMVKFPFLKVFFRSRHLISLARAYKRINKYIELNRNAEIPTSLKILICTQVFVFPEMSPCVLEDGKRFPLIKNNHPNYYCKKVFLNSQGKHLRHANVLKKRYRHRFFSVNLKKFLRTPFL